MKFALIACLVLGSLLPDACSAEPLRVFIRAGKKSHAPGAHDFPQFLADWVPMLNERGAKADGSLEFPTKEQLDRTDVLILHAQEAGNIKIGEERKNLMEFLARGGGLVVIHAAAVSRDHDWFKGIIGGSWKFDQTKWLEAPLSLYFTDRENPITQDISNFDLDDEIYYDMEMLPEVKVLAAAYTPKAKDTGGKGNQEAQQRAAEAVTKKKGVNIYDIQPQMWTYERAAGILPAGSGAGVLPAGSVTGILPVPKKAGKMPATHESGGTPDPLNYRAFTCLPGHWYKNFSHNGLRTAILRGIAWAGKRDNIDELCKPEELGDALRYVEGGVPRPEELPKHLEVHPEFEISLVASEPLINNPMNIDWDEKGRLWVVETPEYPNGLRQANVESWMDSGSVKPGQYERKPLDRVSILEDTDGDGVMDKKTVFADEIELATSSVFYKNGVIVCAAPDVWFFEDTNGDDKADKRTKLYSNLGDRDTHAVINNMRWGLDGWIYATHGYSSTDDVKSGDGSKGFGPIGAGVVRFKPDGSAFEQYASRGGNTWGLDITTDGQVFYTQPTSGNHFIHVVLPEFVLAKGKLPGVVGTNGMLPREPTYPAMQWEQQAYVQIDQVGSYTAAAGCAIYEGGAWPDKWNYGYFTTEPTLNIVSHFMVKPDGVTYQAKREPGREQTEFIRSKNLWFRPIEVRVGPDGALYVVDFCNQAIIHNDTRGPTHGPANAAVRPDRDHYYGRIWKVQHREAKKVEVVKMDKGDKEALIKSLNSSAAAHVKKQALRLLMEINPSASYAAADRSKNSLLEKAGALQDPFGPQPASVPQIISDFERASDDWTRSALISNIANRSQETGGNTAMEAIAECLTRKSTPGVELFASVILPNALLARAAQIRLIKLCASAEAKADAIKIAVLNGLQEGTETQFLDPELIVALKKLLAQPTLAAVTLPLVTKWDKDGALADEVKAQLAQLTTTLADSSAPVEARVTAAGVLASVGTEEAKAKVVAALAASADSEVLQAGLVEALAQNGHAEAMVTSMVRLKPKPLSQAFEAILKRPEAVRVLLDAVRDGTIDRAVFGPGDVARLRNHPNKPLAVRATNLFKVDTSAKDAIIAALVPEVEKPGDAEKGKLYFTAACAVCHKLGDIGAPVGPPLDGMGAHGPAELLIHIVDPNREVDPSFWAFNITTTKNEVLQGVITSENASTVMLATQTGPREIAKTEIAKRENTQRSLMPEGLEALGAEALRDLLAFMCGDAMKQFRIVNLAEAFTADSRAGVFAGPAANQGQVRLAKFGNLQIENIPFLVQDPVKSAAGANLIVLKGGPSPDNLSQTFPQRVEVSVNVQAKRLHLLSGISGWGFPAVQDQTVALRVVALYADGEREVFQLINGVHFSDYIRPVEVPGSRYVEGLTDGQQMRLLTLELSRPVPVKTLVLESPANNRTVPVIAAITADIEGRIGFEPVQGTSGIQPGPNAKGKGKGKGKGKVGQASSLPGQAGGDAQLEPKTGGPNDGPLVPAQPIAWEASKTKVLVIGGGSSHDFANFFGTTDVETLKAAGLSVHYTEDREQATAELANADVAVISVNRKFFDTAAYRKALFDFAAAGKGIVMLHPGTWYGYQAWPELNAKIVGGGARGHDKIHPFDVKKVKDHPVMKGVPDSFTVEDELYYMNAEPDKVPAGTAAIEVLAETSPSDKFQQPHPSVWVTQHPSARIVGITIGHDQRTHDHPAFKTLLENAVKWSANK